MSYTVMGKCSLCGGEVILHDVWASTVPQKPRCATCGATAKPPQNVIEMERPSSSDRHGSNAYPFIGER